MNDYVISISELTILVVEPSMVQAKIIKNLFYDAHINNVQVAADFYSLKMFVYHQKFLI